MTTTLRHGFTVPPGTVLPEWRPCRQHLPRHGIVDVEHATTAAIESADVLHGVRPGVRVAVTVGSRGITGLATVVRTTVAVLRARGADVFIVPAMGSHGGATASGQVDVLASLGVTEDSAGAPIRSSMRTVRLGTVLDGFDVVVDEVAATQADLVVPINRVKPHTDFRGEVESGIHKMLAIGLGKQAGASALHSYPLERFGEIIQAAGRSVLEHLPVAFAVALVEDAHKQLAVIEAIPGRQIPDREPELLRRAHELLPRVPVSRLDVLAIRRFGKDISGAGMDPNVTGTFVVPSMTGPTSCDRVAVLRLTEATHGNAAGIGMADVVTRAVADEIDVTATYTNHLTTHSLVGAKLPVVAATERDALEFCVASLPARPAGDLRLCLIESTVALETMWATQSAVDASDGGLVPTGPARPIAFTDAGELCLPSSA